VRNLPQVFFFEMGVLDGEQRPGSVQIGESLSRQINKFYHNAIFFTFFLDPFVLTIAGSDGKKKSKIDA